MIFQSLAFFFWADKLLTSTILALRLSLLPSIFSFYASLRSFFYWSSSINSFISGIASRKWTYSLPMMRLINSSDSSAVARMSSRAAFRYLNLSKYLFIVAWRTGINKRNYRLYSLNYSSSSIHSGISSPSASSNSALTLVGSSNSLSSYSSSASSYRDI